MPQEFWGADVGQLRSLAKTFDDQANALSSAVKTITTGIQSSVWVGPVAVKFKATWTKQHMFNLNAVQNTLHTQATALRKQAQEQEDASSNSGGVSGLQGGGKTAGTQQKPRSGTIGHAQDLADLCQASYDPPGAVPPGWKEVDPKDLGLTGAQFDDESNSGFYAKLFRDSNGNFVLVFRGSDQGIVTGKDGDDNRVNAFWHGGEQQTQAMLLASRVKSAIARKYPDASLEYAGHSLGGSLASVAAISTGDKATTFNSAGVTNQSIRVAEYLRTGKQDTLSDLSAIAHDYANFLGVGKLMGDGHDNSYRSLITSYYTRNDVLSSVQNGTALSNAVGTRVELSSNTRDPMAAHDLDDIQYGLGQIGRR